MAKKRAAKKTTKKKTTSKRIDWDLPEVKGRRFTLAGSFEHATRAQIEGLIECEGGEVAKTVTAKNNYLVVGETRGGGRSPAETKANELNQNGNADIQILDESRFQHLLARERDLIIALLKSGKTGVKKWNQTLGLTWLKHLNLELTHVDFRNCDLQGADLQTVDLDGCDFRKANLDGVRIRSISNAMFDNATGTVEIEEAEDCSFRGVKCGELRWLTRCDLSKCTLTGLRRHRFNHCNLTGADLAGLRGISIGTGSCFDRADLSNCDLQFVDFKGATFRGTDFTNANVFFSKFQKADFTGARLEDCNAQGAKFSNANLKNVSFRNAKLESADFDGADLTGAKFTNAEVDNVEFTDQQIESAKGLAAVIPEVLIAGPMLKKLDQVSTNSQSMDIEIGVDLPSGEYANCHISSYSNGRNVHMGEQVFSIKGVNNDSQFGRTLSQEMMAWARRRSDGTPRILECTVKASKAPLKRNDLRALVVAGWCEAFGLPVLNGEELKVKEREAKATTKALLEASLDFLKAGTAGVKRWNEMSYGDRKSIRQVRKFDLSSLKLRKVDFMQFDLQETDFSGSDLSDADFRNSAVKKANFDNVNAHQAEFGGSKATEASFVSADLSDARLQHVTLQRADLTGAILKRANFTGADLSGATFAAADLTNTIFERARFDEKTQWPEQFDIPGELVWKGQGKDPRLLDTINKVQAAGPVDFEAFMEQLENNFDAARLKKAMKMLKADAFQLYADVQEDSVNGVVKSQTDPDLVYSCRIDAEGTFACCTQNLNPCGGLRGALCKHLLVLVIGLTKGEELDATTINAWVTASKLQGPNLDKDLMSEVLLKYKGAEAGDIDWRPTETVPEDYYAF